MKNLILLSLLLLATGCGSSSSNKNEQIEDEIVETVETVEILDTQAPIITLNGNATITIIEGGEFQELGATAVDNIDGNIEVRISGIINTAKVGDYTIEYYAIDKAGNEANTTRVIHILSAPKEEIAEDIAEDINHSVEENTTSSTPTINIFNVAPIKKYYITSIFKQSTIFSNIDLGTGQVNIEVNDILKNKRGLSFSRYYNSYNSINRTVGTFETNYGSYIDAKLPENIKSNHYFTPRNACKQGWRDIASNFILENYHHTEAIYDEDTTLCNVYIKDNNEDNDKKLIISLFTKDIYNKMDKKIHTLTRPNGKTYIFYKKNNKWITNNNVPIQIKKINGNFVISSPDDIVEEYNYYGKLVSLRKNSKTINLIYDENQTLVTIRDSFHKEIKLSYNEDGLLFMVKSYDNTYIKYEYNNHKRLIKVIYPDKSHETYNYDNNGNLINIMNSSGTITKTFVYDTKGRAIETKGINNCNKIELEYLKQQTKTIKNLEEKIYTFKLIESKILLTAITTDDGASTIEYDNYGYPLTSTDILGNITKTVYSKEGLLLEKIDNANTSNSKKSTIKYDKNYFGKPILVNDGYTVTSYLYSTYGELLQKLVSANNREDMVTLYGYDYRSNKITTIQPNGGIISHEYDINGDKNSTVDILGFTTQSNSFDIAGRVLTSSDINEINSSMSYDIMGRLLSYTKDSQTTTYVYDINGKEIKTTYPNGLIVEKTYDEHGNILKITNNKKEKIVYSYACNNLIATKVFKDEVLISNEEFEYDNKNQIITKIDGLGGQTLYSYNPKGEKISEIDALGRVTTYEYNNQSKLLKETTSDGNTTTYSYNRDGQKTKTLLPNGTSIKISYDIFGRIIKKDNISYTYDIGNRKLTSIHTDDNTLNESYEYDQGENAKGKLSKISNAQGEIEFTYDIHGNISKRTEMINDINSTIEFTYDDKNRLESKIYSNGKVVKYGYLKDEITDITVDNKVFIKNIKRNQNGLIEYKYANGDSYQKEYNLNAQPIKLIYPNYTKNITYNAIGEITDITIEGEENNATQNNKDALFYIKDTVLEAIWF